MSVTDQNMPAVPAGEAVGEAAMKDWAELLVAQARAEGVELTGDGGLLTGLVRQVLQTGLEVETGEHLGYERHAVEGRGSGNSRNGSTPKTVTTEIGEVDLAVPRDRAGTFEPTTVPKHRRRLDGLSGNVISLYAKGLTTGEIQDHLEEIYDTSVSRETISKITDEIVADMAAWQNRPLDPVYAVLLIDAIVVKVRDSQVANRPVYVAIGVDLQGERDVLGMWLGPSGGEGAKQWATMLTELRNRGLTDALIVCCDGLRGLPESIRATWPEATVQTCVVHMVRINRPWGLGSTDGSVAGGCEVLFEVFDDSVVAGDLAGPAALVGVVAKGADVVELFGDDGFSGGVGYEVVALFADVRVGAGPSEWVA